MKEYKSCPNCGCKNKGDYCLHCFYKFKVIKEDKTCQNCFFWKREITEKWEAIQSQKIYGDCSCDRFFYVESFRSESEHDCLMYSDSEGYKASFVTGESFGCIHFKEKD